MIAAVMVGNFINFVFNAVLGRVLTLEQFSILTLVNTLWFIITVFLNSLSSTANNRTAYLSAKRGIEITQGFRSFITKRSLLISSFLVFVWLLLIPLFSLIFHTSNYLLFLTITPAILFGIFAAVNRGYFQGSLSFIKAALIIITESITKLLIALIFIFLGLKEYVYLSIPLSIFCAFLVTCLFVFNLKKQKSISYTYIFPKKLLFATFLTIFSSVAFLSVDLLLARHFLSATESGAYSLLSLVGKMVFFIGSLLNVFILTLASRDTGFNKNSTTNFYKILGINIGLLLIAFLSLGIFGNTLVPLLFGEKSRTILGLLIPYTLGISLFTVANAFATYHLAKQQFIFAYNSIAVTILAVVGIIIWHNNIGDFVNVIVISSYLYLALNALCHIFYKDILEYHDNEDTQKLADFEKIQTKSPSVSICLPAYNEQHNIDNILKQILSQKQDGFVIEKIIVASDGSTDDTVKIVREYENRGVEVIEGKDNRGQTYRQNEIISKTSSDILVLLNADLLLGDDEVILRLISPVLGGADLSAQWAKPLAPHTFIERILCAGFELKYFIYTRNKNGNNIYTCVGHIRALSRKFYSNVVFPTVSDGEDQYLYLACISGGYRYKYIHSGNLYFKLPDTLSDYKKYAKRIFQTQKKYDDVFSKQLVHIERSLPIGLQIRGCIYGLSKHPLYASLYIVLHIIMWHWALRQPFNSAHVFETSTGTKKIFNNIPS